MFRLCACRRKLKSTVLCVVFYLVLVNAICLYYLTKSPSPWMSRHGPFYLQNYRSRWWTCRPIRMSAHPLPLTALASFPGSGNTWVRHLVQQATGIATGSVYNDTGLKLLGFPAEGISSQYVALIKTHQWGDAFHGKFQRAVLLVREPFGTLLAEFNRRYGGHRGHADSKYFKKYWREYLAVHSRAWLESNNDWLKFHGALYIMQYKDLKNNLLYEIKGLLTFLGLNVTESNLSCMMSNSNGHFKRSKAKVPQKDLFSAYMRQTINKYIGNVTEEIENFKKIT